MSTALSRSLSPRSVALLGPSEEIAAVLLALRAAGYPWSVWPVTEGGARIEGVAAFAALSELPGAPDLAFVALRGAALRPVLEELAQRGAGGAVCPWLDAAELAGMGPLPLPVFPGGLLSGAARLPLWPGARRLPATPRGAALLLSDPARLPQLLSLRHGLPLSYVVPLAEGPALRLEALAEQLLADERVTALAVQSERISGPDTMRELGRLAQHYGKPLIYLSAGLAPGPAALLRRAGISHVGQDAALIEALWILHLVGPLPANALAALVCAPGLTARARAVAARQGLHFAPLSALQQEALDRALPAGRTAQNPLDVSGLMAVAGDWPDTPDTPEADSLARIFAEMMAGGAVLTLAVIRNAGESGWARAAEAAAQARERVGMPLALLAPNRAEMTETRSLALLEAGVIPLAGLKPALEALRATIEIGSLAPVATPLLMPRPGAGAAVVRGGAEVGAVLGLPLRARRLDVGGALRLSLSADPGFGYLLELAAPRGLAASGLLPLSPRACRDMAARLELEEAEAAALVAVLRAVQEHVAASEGAVAGLEIALDFGDNGSAEARSIELRVWDDDVALRRRSPE